MVHMTGSILGMDGHSAGGRATLTMSGGQSRLALKGFRSDPSPRASIYLSPTAEYGKGIELGKFDRFEGDYSCLVPAGIDPRDFRYVIIHSHQTATDVACARLFETSAVRTKGER